jgi:hypothetical protein
MGAGNRPRKGKDMDEKEKVLTEVGKAPIPYAAFEREMARADEREQRHWIAHIVSGVVILAVIAGFLLYMNQYDFLGYAQDGAGVNVMGNMLGSMNGGEYNNGTESESS